MAEMVPRMAPTAALLPRGCGRCCVWWALRPAHSPSQEQASKAARGKRLDAAVSAPPGDIVR